MAARLDQVNRELEIIKRLKVQPSSAWELARYFDRTKHGILAYIRRLADADRIHICHWKRHSITGGPAPVWALGKGINAQKPLKLRAGERKRRYLARKNAFASIFTHDRIGVSIGQ